MKNIDVEILRKDHGQKFNSLMDRDDCYRLLIDQTLDGAQCQQLDTAIRVGSKYTYENRFVRFTFNPTPELH